MADTVDTKTIFNGKNILVVKLINISDGTGESDVVKVDISTLVGPYEAAPKRLKLTEVKWSIQGFSSVRLEWDATTDDEMLVLAAGQGEMDFSKVGGLVDPFSSGATGDVLLTTAGNVAGATYDITLVFRKLEV